MSGKITGSIDVVEEGDKSMAFGMSIDDYFRKTVTDEIYERFGNQGNALAWINENLVEVLSKIEEIINSDDLRISEHIQMFFYTIECLSVKESIYLANLFISLILKSLAETRA